jgi:hypothetical protein
MVTGLRSLFLAVVVLTSGCASLGGDSRSPEEIVAERAQQRQDLLLAPDYEAVYEFLSPGYRDVVPYRRYLGSLGSAVKRVGADVQKVKCESETVCFVFIEVNYFYTPTGMQGKIGDTPISRISEERWIKADGQWWLYKKP